MSPAVPKPTPRWRKKVEERAAELRQMREVYAQVSARDGHCCRVCSRRVGGVDMVTRGHHHHLQYRSRGGQHTTDNLVLLCARCHQAVHDAEIRLSGNADARLPVTGVLCGVTLERYENGGWRRVGQV